jgi:Ni,Fe-hydrogenase I large subunit
MGQRITVDPVTRIEGHLKIEVEIENGVVKDAWSSGTMARGFEALLTGKDPRDASYVTSRFCGVCFSVHTMASAACLDDAFGAQVPDDAFSATSSWGQSISTITSFTSITLPRSITWISWPWQATAARTRASTRSRTRS